MEQLSRVDFQQDYSYIAGFCMSITDQQQQLSSMDPISEHAKWLLNMVLERTKQELTSMTSHIQDLRNQADELTKRLLAAHSKLEASKLDSQTKENQITEVDQTRSPLIASQSQMENDLMAVHQSKYTPIAEVGERIAKSYEGNLSSKVVGFERKLRTGSPKETGAQYTSGKIISSSLETELDSNFGFHCHSLYEWKKEEDQTSDEFLSSAFPETNYRSPTVHNLISSSMTCLPEQHPVALQPHTNTWRRTSKPGEEAAKQTRDRELIPVSDFVVISQIGQTEDNNKLVLTNIPNCDYGHVVGREGKNIERLKNVFCVKINLIDFEKEFLMLVISGANAQSRRAAASDIIGNLPIVVECPNLKLNISNRRIKRIKCDYQVQLIRPGCSNNSHVTLRGKRDDCRIVYRLLANDTKLWYSK